MPNWFKKKEVMSTLAPLLYPSHNLFKSLKSLNLMPQFDLNLKDYVTGCFMFSNR